MMTGKEYPRRKSSIVFFGAHPRVHALGLLRRRLRSLFGRSFRLEVCSEVGQGTTITMRIPLRKRLGDGSESSEISTSDLRELA